jgi:hypothetical protein
MGSAQKEIDSTVGCGAKIKKWGRAHFTFLFSFYNLFISRKGNHDYLHFDSNLHLTTLCMCTNYASVKYVITFGI